MTHPDALVEPVKAQPTCCVADPFQELLELGAERFDHVSGSLAQHLRRTEALLRSWGNREALCLAGLYHAVYGTEGIQGSLVGVDARNRIAGVIGIEAERAAYLYGACDREQFHARIGRREQLRFVDRFAHSEYWISESELRDFCELTIANELELAMSSEAFRLEYRDELDALFDRVRDLVSEGARTSHRRTLRNSE